MNLGRVRFEMPPAPPTDADELRELRLRAARRNQAWTELDEADLVPRGPRGWLVHKQSDQIYTAFSGDLWQRGAARSINGSTPLFFFVDADGQVVPLERKQSTWSEVVERQAKARA